MRLLVLLLLASSALAIPHSINTPLGGVASESKVCSQIGADTLRKNHGNAVDALIATVLCVGTVAPHHSGPAGGGFALLRTRKSYAFHDFREVAPAAATENQFVNRTGSPSLYSGEAVGVPGEIAGLETLHKLYGSLPWEGLFKPAIKLAKEGFKVSTELGEVIANPTYEFVFTKPGWKEDYAPGGKRVKTGDVMTRKVYATTLQKLAKGGAKEFYHGEIGKDIVRTVQENGGIITAADLAAYKVVKRKTFSVKYKGFTITSGEAPSSGVAVLLALKIYEGFKAAPKVLSLHRLIEATKFAFGARTQFGDPSFIADQQAYQSSLLAPSYPTSLRKLISDTHTNPPAYYTNATAPPTHGTSAISILTPSLSITVTTTINTWFGSRIISPRTGLILNNEMDDFSIPGKNNFFGFPPSPANFIRPGARPLSSISTVIVEGGKGGETRLVVSAAGGSRIVTSVLQTVWGVLEGKDGLREAVAEPRWHEQLGATGTAFEYTFNNATVAGLKEKGGNVTWVAEGSSAVQAVGRVGRLWEAVGEPRQGSAGGVLA